MIEGCVWFVFFVNFVGGLFLVVLMKFEVIVWV